MKIHWNCFSGLIQAEKDSTYLAIFSCGCLIIIIDLIITGFTSLHSPPKTVLTCIYIREVCLASLSLFFPLSNQMSEP